MDESNINILANKIVQFEEDYDYYDFYDNYNSFSEAIESVKRDLISGKIDNYIESFIDVIELNAFEKDMTDDYFVKQTDNALSIVKLLNKYLLEYKKSLEDNIGIN